MAYVDIEYKNHSFEESPGLITWLQLYLLRFLRELKDAPAWTQILAEEWELNAQIDIYKYFFSDEILSEPHKEKWAIQFIGEALAMLNNTTLQEFGAYIGEDINPRVDFERLKKILLNVELMLEGKEPLSA